MLRQDGLTGPKVWARLAFFLPGFHPRKHDDRALIGLAESDYAAAVLPGAQRLSTAAA